MIPQKLSFFFTLSLLFSLVLMSSCAHRKNATLPEMSDVNLPAKNILVQEAKAESAQLRSALASERIKSAKQAATLRMVQEQAAGLREQIAEHTAYISRLKNEVETIKAERDRLRTDNVELRAQTASLPELLKMVTQMRTLETSLTGMTSSLASLSGEISHIKEDINKKEPPPTQHVKKKPSPAPATARVIDPSKTELITVERGDSLWRLGRQYAISIQDLKDLNDLESDQILIGQQIRVPVHTTQPNEEMAGMPSPSKTPNP